MAKKISKKELYKRLDFQFMTDEEKETFGEIVKTGVTDYEILDYRIKAAEIMIAKYAKLEHEETVNSKKMEYRDFITQLEAHQRRDMEVKANLEKQGHGVKAGENLDKADNMIMEVLQEEIDKLKRELEETRGRK